MCASRSSGRRPLTDPRHDAPLIGVRLSLTGEPGELFADARAIESAGAAALWLDAAEGDPYVALAALAAVTWRIRLVASGAPDAAGRTTCERIARGRLAVAEELERAGEHWISVPFPADRAAWRAVRSSAAAGVTGIVLPNDPRLLDLLRNPDVDDDRSDLNVAVG